jgi:DNA-binding CsgD family transcriptional regulator
MELEALPVNAAILDAAGTIISVNDSWREFARQNGLRLPNFGIGFNYLQFCTAYRECSSPIAEDLKDLLTRRRPFLTLVYQCNSSAKKQWFSLIGLPLGPRKSDGVVLLHLNLTDTLSPAIGRTVKVDSKRQIRITDAVSMTMERSVLSPLSSQLNLMCADTHGGAERRDTSVDRDAKEVPSSAQLSKRQMEVFRLLAEGKTNKEIAHALSRSPYTIKLHVSAILKQLNFKSRTQAALLASKIYKENSGRTLGKHYEHKLSRAERTTEVVFV